MGCGLRAGGRTRGICRNRRAPVKSPFDLGHMSGDVFPSFSHCLPKSLSKPLDTDHCSCCLVTKSCLTLCNSMDCSQPGSSVHGIFQAKILGSGLPCPPPGDLPDQGIEPLSPALTGGFFITESPGKSHPLTILFFESYLRESQTMSPHQTQCTAMGRIWSGKHLGSPVCEKSRFGG